MSSYHVRTYRAQRRRQEIAQWARLVAGFAIVVAALLVFHMFMR